MRKNGQRERIERNADGKGNKHGEIGQTEGEKGSGSERWGRAE